MELQLNNEKINTLIYSPRELENKEQIKERLKEKERIKAKHLLSQAMSHYQALKVFSQIEKDKLDKNTKK